MRRGGRKEARMRLSLRQEREGATLLAVGGYDMLIAV